MDRNIRRSAVKSCVGVLLSIVLFFSAGVQLPSLDSTADHYFKDSISKAGVSYGVCRVINGTVSVIQESSIQLEPAGIGLALAVGQIVDPINDMVERLSDVLVLSIATLGVQALSYEISVAVAPPVMAVLLLALSILIWFNNNRLLRLRRIMAGVLFLVVIARLCLPISSMANTFLQARFFDVKIAEANAKLSATTSDLEQFEEVSIPKTGGLLGTIGDSASYIKEKAVDFKNTIQAFSANKGVIIENLLRLTLLYLGIFVLQVLVLPMLTFWLLSRIVQSLFVGGAAPTTVPLL